jgi:hypothetical protein
MGAKRHWASSDVEAQMDSGGRETVGQQRCGGAAVQWEQRDSGPAALWKCSRTVGVERQGASSAVEVQQDSGGINTVGQKRCGGAAGQWGPRDSGASSAVEV